MPEKFRNKSLRLEGYDYRSEGGYFITICTHSRIHYFGECKDGIMYLSELGLLAQQYWFQIPEHFPNVSLGECVVMPNHIHGMIIINKKINLPISLQVETNHHDGTQLLPVTREHMDEIKLSGLAPKNLYFQNLSAPAKSISTIIRAYKSAVTRNSRIYNEKFKWQTRFHDHIIRNQCEYDRISNYILTNPKNWKEDNL